MQTTTSSINEALKRIPPLWPLENFVAVNPFVGMLDQPYEEACATLARTSGNYPLQSPSDYLKAWQTGIITPQDISEIGGDQIGMLNSLKNSSDSNTVIPTVADFLDRELPHAHWAAFMRDQISKWCGVNHDDNQTTWRSPWHGSGLFSGWKSAASYDLNPEAFGLKRFRKSVAALPTDARECIAHCLAKFCPPAVDSTDFLHRQLMTISGWAGHIQYRVREDALRSKENDSLADLLAIRLAYDSVLFDAFLAGHSNEAAWFAQHAPCVDKQRIATLARWQQAYETGYRRELAEKLLSSKAPASKQRPSFQAVFCIDVRSEVLRRHLESAAPDATTHGFAGFFGFSVAHRTATDGPATARCPVLLVPTMETATPCEADHNASLGAWKAFQNSAASCFTFVESAGWLFGATLAKRIASKSQPIPAEPKLVDQSLDMLEQRIATAEGALRNMGLTKDFARLILICGHGSKSANNPHASSLECGACGGHAGDVNARLAAATLNDPAIRASLADRGIQVPTDTWFLAGLHLTTTDEVTLFDTGRVPTTHSNDLTQLTEALLSAGEAARIERAPALGEKLTNKPSLLDNLLNRSADISQVRPEWGLANNAAFVAAPRWRTSKLNLQGRVFLQDYDDSNDSGDNILTLILCAPVVVASWINLQYYASRLDPAHHGAGNKTLHHVAGGIGVMEGNGGDLKTGLPMQSIHDGERFIHEPRRLTVFIETKKERISAVLAAKPDVKMLFDHQWIHLCAIEGNSCLLYQAGEWKSIAAEI